ncbi:hypothetical protein [Nocardioides renjunii]|uniref:hypothetical protein n=1 Tax=Nocardioides renjunii TaxID=3095075 RepID=UPI002B000EDF|nr:hypothetical protein [Nocardioides sp. S-34]WQQ21980.1 hypothetical protein SHK17_19080 [Nocardioides sp. S-34]
MDVRLHGFFSEFVERVDDYLPRCKELVNAWGDRALSVGTLRQDGAPAGNTFKESVFSHVVKELARSEAERSDEHRCKFANLEIEVRRRDSRRHRALEQEIERATERASVLSDELSRVRSNVADASKQLDVLESGEGFRLGLRVLGLVSTLVIVPPVVLLLLRPDGWGAWWPALAVAVLFGGGVAVTLRYLYVYSSFIQGRVTLPHSPLQLLRSQTAAAPPRASGTSERLTH